MRKLDFDFHIQRRRNAWAGWALLLLGLALWGEMSFSYISLQQEMSGLEKRLLKNGWSGKALQRKGVASYTSAEFAQAQETIARIAIPWNDLFHALEKVKVERVALLALESDPKAGTVLLRGEAGDLPALLTYVARLGSTGQLDEVYLLRHEFRRDGNPQRPLAFSISARWGARS